MLTMIRATSSASLTLPRFALFDQTPRRCQCRPAGRSIGRTVGVYGLAERDPRGYVAQRGRHHLECGGEPLAILLPAAQEGQRVAQGRGGEYAADDDRDDYEI